jgi:putative ABC transport system ATP-binding protein
MTATATAVVSAQDVTRRYGEGDAAVDALRGITLDILPGQFAAVMGPSGSGKSTLMHIMAGLDKPTSGIVEIAGTDITNLSDSRLTLLRRHQVGFIFQFFNLLPMLTAEENILLPLRLAGENIDRTWADEIIDQVGRPSCPAASSSAWPSRALSPRGRPCSSPTSRRATSTRRPAARS